MKWLIIAFGLVYGMTVKADSVLDNNYICEDGKVVTVNAAGLSVGGELHEYVGQTPSHGMRDNGTVIHTTATEYAGQWFFITGRDVATGLLVHNEDSYYCESSWRAK